MNISAIISCSFFLWLCLCDRVICQPRVGPVSISPPRPVSNSSVTLQCEAFEFDPGSHNFTWQRFVGSMPAANVTVDERVSFSPVRPVQGLAGDYFQTVIIKPLRESDEGTYRCLVIELGSGNTLAQGQGDLLVNRPEEFPVCFPDGPAEMTEGDTLSCRTVVGSRVPVVHAAGDPQGTSLNWTKTSPDGGSGSELQHSATSEDNGRTFICFSTTSDPRMVLSCTIGPLTSSTPDTECPRRTGAELSPVSIACIAVTACVIVATIFINIFCCQYNPRRWRQFLGMFTRTEDPGQDQNVPQSTIQSRNTANTTDPAANPTYIDLDPSDQKASVYTELTKN